MTARLFEPLRLDDLTLDNRIIVAPMCQYSAHAGQAGDWHLMHLGAMAMSGAGLLTLEATAVSPEGRISPTDLGLYSDETERALGRVLDAVRGYAPIPIAIQINHAGRKASSQAPWDGGAQIAPDAPDGWRTEAPSAVAHGDGEVPPHALDADGFEAHPRRLRRHRAPGAQHRHRRVRAAWGARLPPAPVPVAALESAHGRVRRQPAEPHAFPARMFRGGPGGGSRRQTGLDAGVGHRLGRGWLETSRRPSSSPTRSSAVARRRSTSPPAVSPPSRRSRSRRATRCPSPSASRPRPGSRRSRSG